jgi:RND family efflux transporter MFP subunit
MYCQSVPGMPWICHRLALSALCLVMVSCGDTSQETVIHDNPRPVRMTAVKSGPASVMDAYSAVVRASRETVIASKIPGRIEKRVRRSGERIKAGEALFVLDTREWEQAVNVARAGVASAEAELDIAAADLGRWERLIARDAASRQSWEQAVRTQRSAEARLAMMQARLEVADSQRDETVIRAPFSGYLGRILAEEGQVISPGQGLADFHAEGAKELEVDVPDSMSPPATGLAFLSGQAPVEVALRETSAVLDSSSRTQRLRYGLPEAVIVPPGSIARLQLALLPLTLPGTQQAVTLSVPVGAIDDRGGGPQVWTVHDGLAQPVAVQVLMMAPEEAVIAAPLPVGSRIVAVGTHVLSTGMAVREL